MNYGDLSLESGRVPRLFEELGMISPPSAEFAPVLQAVVGSSFRHNSVARSNRKRLAEIVEEVVAERSEIEDLSKSLTLR